MKRVAAAAKAALDTARPVTHIGLGTGRVEEVASNRRILGPDGRLILRRHSSGGRNPAAREAPEGTLDPLVKLITFWNNDQPCAVLTYYATHPQSYYGRGSVNWDFVGMAREIREKTRPGVPRHSLRRCGRQCCCGQVQRRFEGNTPRVGSTSGGRNKTGLTVPTETTGHGPRYRLAGRARCHAGKRHTGRRAIIGETVRS